MTRLLAIDPGVNGGLAWVDSDGIVRAEKMPDGMTAIVDKLRELQAYDGFDGITMEDVGTYMPGNSGPAAATFARHIGNLETAIYMLQLPLSVVRPQKWEKESGFSVTKHRPPNYADLKARVKEFEVLVKAKKKVNKEEMQLAKKALAAADAKAKQEHKGEIKESMQRRYPHLRVTLATADALGILTWALGREK
jgi:hypothetical protein